MVEDKIEPAGKTIPVSGVAISRIVFISIIFAILSFPLFTGYAITRSTGMAFHDSLKISGLLSAYFGFFYFLFYWIFQYCSRGILVIDCGRNKKQSVYLFTCGFCLILGMILKSDFSFVNFIGVENTILVFPILFCLFLATRRLQVLENGIWAYIALVRWKEIESYSWGDDSELILNTKWRWLGISGASRSVYLISCDLRAAVDVVLQQYVPSHSGLGNHDVREAMDKE
jgi:hypothetical protein